jgi:transcriptional regulator with XRE-family HTH domain
MAIMTGKGGIKFNYSMSDDAILKLFGTQIKQMRLNKNLTQGELSELAGLSRSTISEMENGGLGTMNSLIQILRTLDKIEILNHFITEAPISPLQIAKLHGKTRKRASGNRQIKENREESEW